MIRNDLNVSYVAYPNSSCIQTHYFLTFHPPKNPPRRLKILPRDLTYLTSCLLVFSLLIPLYISIKNYYFGNILEDKINCRKSLVVPDQRYNKTPIITILLCADVQVISRAICLSIQQKVILRILLIVILIHVAVNSN